MALTNNDILKKIRVALKLRDDDMIRILRHVDYEISKSEINAFFRAEDHPKYMQLKDQILRNFLNGLIIEKRGKMEPKTESSKPKSIKTSQQKNAPSKSPSTKRKPFGGEAGKIEKRKRRPRIGE